MDGASKCINTAKAVERDDSASIGTGDRRGNYSRARRDPGAARGSCHRSMSAGIGPMEWRAPDKRKSGDSDHPHDGQGPPPGRGSPLRMSLCVSESRASQSWRRRPRESNEFRVPDSAASRPERAKCRKGSRSRDGQASTAFSFGPMAHCVVP